MATDHTVQIIVVLILAFSIFYFVRKSWSSQSSAFKKEGLTTMTPPVLPNQASGANNFATQLKQQVGLQLDAFNITKYRKDYEDIILNMESYVHGLILQKLLSIDTETMKPEEVATALEQATKLNASISTLESALKFVDGTH